MRNEESLAPTERFSSRVADYVRARPSYPAAVLDFLEKRCGFNRDWVVADVGAGTGISTQLFAEHGNVVYAIEPNAAMREAGEDILAAYPRVSWREGTAEATGLPAASLDLVLAAQAFHWFDLVLAQQEFRRILRSGGFVALLWNDRRSSGTPFLVAYEQFLLEYATDYQKVNHRNVDGQHLDSFWGAGCWESAVVPHVQRLDWFGFLARVQSSSYIPSAEHPQYPVMRQALEVLFAEHAQSGEIEIVYDARLYWGPL